jgi:hypothetical protein
MRTRFLMLVCLLAAPGCANKGYQVVPVSGKVTLNGKALPKAWVHFAPVATRDNKTPGPTSHGQTDNEGKFTLHIDPEHPGSVVGKCRVYITLRQAGGSPGGTAKQPDAGGIREKELLPRRYNEETELTFDVPGKGTDQANFELASP